MNGVKPSKSETSALITIVILNSNPVYIRNPHGPDPARIRPGKTFANN